MAIDYCNTSEGKNFFLVGSKSAEIREHLWGKKNQDKFKLLLPMIRTMYQFGLHLREIEEMKPYFEIAVAPYSEKSTDEKVIIIAEIENRQFANLTLTKYSKALVPKYLYRTYPPRGTSIVPTLLFHFDTGVNKKTGKDNLDENVEKFVNKFIRCLDTNKAIYEKFFDTESLKGGLEIGFKAFVQEKFTEKKNYLFTLQVDNQWLGDLPEIKNILEKNAYDSYFKDAGGNLYLSKDKVCAVTYEKSDDVWGWVSMLGFTVEKPSFSRSGFDPKQSYKMFSASPQAVKILEGTMQALDGQLGFNFHSLKFFVLPHFITLTADLLRQKNIARAFVKKITAPEEPGFDPLLNAIVGSEAIFSKIIDDPELGKNSIYYDIFFYEERQAQFAIKLHVSDVLPSRFRAIRDAKRWITNFYKPITLNKFKDKEFSPNFYGIKDYFAIKREKETIIEPYFFKIVEAVFYKNRLDEEQVIRAFMQKIVQAFKNSANKPYEFVNHVKHSLCIHQFFQHLQLFGKMEPITDDTIVLFALEFVKQHEAFFKNRLQKASFLLGCAVEVLLGSQRSNLNGNEPFAKRLNNLSVDYRELQRIKTELLAKSKQYADAKKLYGSDYLQKMLVEFDRLMLDGDDPNLSKTQISYAFSVGLVMEKEFTKLRIADYKAQKDAKMKSQEPKILGQ